MFLEKITSERNIITVDIAPLSSLISAQASCLNVFICVGSSVLHPVQESDGCGDDGQSETSTGPQHPYSASAASPVSPRHPESLGYNLLSPLSAESAAGACASPLQPESLGCSRSTVTNIHQESDGCNEDGPIETYTVPQHPNVPEESDGYDDDGPIATPTVPQHPNIHTQDTRNCEICHEVYSSEDSVLILPCKHFFHGNCVLR